MKKEIRVYRAETKKPRKEFTGMLRMFEPIRNLAITVSSFILITTLIIVIIIIQAQEAARFRLDNWTSSFENWREAWDYVSDQNNYDVDYRDVEAFRFVNGDDYYGMNGTDHLTEDHILTSLSQRASNNGEWSEGYSDVVLTDGISATDEAFYTVADSYKVYDSASADAVFSDFRAIESYLKASTPNFEYNQVTRSDVNDIYDEYKTQNTLTFESVKGYEYKEYISTDGNYTNIINHLGWQEDPEDFVDDIFPTVYSIELALITDLPVNFHTKDIWSDERFDTNFTEMFTAWELDNTGLTTTDYLASVQSDTDYSTWKSEPDQLNRKAWNCNDYEYVEIDTCSFVFKDSFTDSLRTFLVNHYSDMANMFEMDLIIPSLDGEHQFNYLNNLITDASVMEEVYLADLIRSEVIKNNTSYEWVNADYPGLDSSSGWTRTVLYDKALEWFNEHLNENGWKYVLKADAVAGGEFALMNGSSTEVSRFTNFNNTGTTMFYEENKDLVDFLMIETNNTGINIRIADIKGEFYRLDIDNDNDYAERHFNRIDLINYWKNELNKNRP